MRAPAARSRSARRHERRPRRGERDGQGLLRVVPWRLDDGRHAFEAEQRLAGHGLRHAQRAVDRRLRVLRWANWGGRFDSQWSLTLAVAENAKIMKSTRLAIAHRLWDAYRTEYDAVCPVPLDGALDPNAADAARFPAAGKPGDAARDAMAPADQAVVNRIFANYGKAVAAYMRKLVSGNAAFDRLVAGQPTAIDAAAERGLQVFLGKGRCVECHSGPTFADDAFHAIGVADTDHARARERSRSLRGRARPPREPVRHVGRVQRRHEHGQAHRPRTERVDDGPVWDEEPPRRGRLGALHARGPARDARGGDRLRQGRRPDRRGQRRTRASSRSA